MEFVLVDEQLDLNKAKKRTNRWSDAVEALLGSDKKSLIVKCKSAREQRNAYTCIDRYIKGHNLNMSAGRYGASEVWVVKA